MVVKDDFNMMMIKAGAVCVEQDSGSSGSYFCLYFGANTLSRYPRYPRFTTFCLPALGADVGMDTDGVSGFLGAGLCDPRVGAVKSGLVEIEWFEANGEGG